MLNTSGIVPRHPTLHLSDKDGESQILDIAQLLFGQALSIRSTIEAVFEEELEQIPGRCQYGRGGEAKAGCRHGHRERQLTGTFGPETVNIPRARITGEDGKATEWRSKALPRCQRLTKKAEALIAAVCLSGTITLAG
jgi:transposase-like protein